MLILNRCSYLFRDMSNFVKVLKTIFKKFKSPICTSYINAYRRHFEFQIFYASILSTVVIVKFQLKSN